MKLLKRVVSGIMLILLLTGMLTLAFSIQSIKAQTAITADEWNITQITTDPSSDQYSVIAVDKNGVAHIAWGTGTDYLGQNLYYANSSNNWEKVLIASETALISYLNAPSIYIDDNNVVYIAWVDMRNQWSAPDGSLEGCDIYYAKSSDGWIEHLVTSYSDLRCFDPSIAVDNTGNVHISYIRHTVAGWPYNPQLFYANENSGWVETRVSYTVYSRIGWSSMDIDSEGNVHIAFSNEQTGMDPGQTEHIFYANSLSGWANIQIDSNATENWWDDRVKPTLMVDSNNVVHIVWQDNRNTALEGDPAYHGGIPNRMEIYYANSNTGWINTEIALPVDTKGPAVKRRPSIFVDDRGIVHTTWLHQTSDEDYSQTNFYYSNSNDWNSAVNVTNLPDEPVKEDFWWRPAVYLGSSRQALAVDSSGRVHVTWFDDRTGDYNIYYASTSVSASIDVDPYILNLKSKGKWITVYVELPEGYDVVDINASTIMLNGTVPVDLCAPIVIGDYDNDSVPDLMVGFNGTLVSDFILSSGVVFGNVTLTLTGELYSGTFFEGSDIILVSALTGDINVDGKVDMRDLSIVALAFGSYPGDPRWNPEADINGDNKIDMRDLVFICKNFGKQAYG